MPKTSTQATKVGTLPATVVSSTLNSPALQSAKTQPQPTTPAATTTAPKIVTPVATTTTLPCDCQPAPMPKTSKPVAKLVTPPASVAGPSLDSPPARPATTQAQLATPYATTASTPSDTKSGPAVTNTFPSRSSTSSMATGAVTGLTVSPKLDVWKPTTPTPVAQAPTTYASTPSKLGAEPAQPTDWRQAWGKTDTPYASTKSMTTLPEKPATSTSKMTLPSASKSDPLSDPAQYTRSAVEQKVAPGPQVTKAITPPAAPKPADMPAPSAMKMDNGFQLPPATVSAPRNDVQQVPLGHRSIVDASISASEVAAAPTPPKPLTLSAPPAPAPAPASPAPGPMVNAFTAAPPAMPASGPSVNAFTAANPAPAVVASAFGTPPMPQPTWQPASGAGYAAASRPMLPPMPAMPLASPMPQTSAPAAYAASPTMTGAPGVAYAMATPQTGLTLTSHSMVPATADGQLPARGSLNTPEMLSMLRDSLLPSQREWAADQLGTLDWKANQPVVDALVKGCRQDPAATVRASCVRSLARMNVNLVPVVDALRGLRSDADPRVQTEVEQALVKLGGH
jgi:hypothetical protein